MNFEEQLSAKVQQVNDSLLSALPSREVKPARLHQAIRHSSEAGGKRLRPVLLHAAYDLFPGSTDPMPAAIAIECIHTYSLIHDDLPAMDDSDTRRGQPACHKAFDEATAILAGDALQPMAFELLAKGYQDIPEVSVDLVRMLAETAGSEQLVGGQMQDLLSEGQEPDVENLEFIHKNKTAAMIRASLQMGFRLGEKGGDEDLITIMGEAGNSLGLAFQAVDDLLDVTQTSEELGKDAAHDAVSGKVTWIGLLGEEKARALANKHTQDTITRLEEVGGDNAFLLELVRRMLERTH
jgi:geranylgeranyl pyrophosphate synthase